MQDEFGQHADEPSGIRAYVGSVLFLALFLLYWITFDPFVDLTTGAALDQAARESNPANQVVSVGLFILIAAFGMTHPLRNIMLQPRYLVAVIFLWLIITSSYSGYSTAAIKGLILLLISWMNANFFLLLPKSSRHFAKLLGLGALIVLATAYYGIVFKPLLSIHQASEAMEQIHAGFWRGHFRHKNDAAAAMVVMTFFGLFVMREWSRIIGIAIAVLAFVFLMNTGGKTATAMLPAILCLAWLFERKRSLRVGLTLGGVALINIVVLCAATIAPLNELVTEMGIDATFTNRADVWRVALSALAERPLTGYGMKGFWQTSSLVYSGGTVETWAVTAAHAHNAYLDSAITMGLPGLLLTLSLALVAPLYYYSRLPPEVVQTPLTRLYLRIWLYAIFHASLENLFYEGSSPLWFALLVALYGLALQGSAVLAVSSPTWAQPVAAHA